MHASGMGRLGRGSVVAVARPPARRSQVVRRTSSTLAPASLQGHPGRQQRLASPAAAVSRTVAQWRVVSPLFHCWLMAQRGPPPMRPARPDGRRYGRNLSIQPSLPIRLIADQCPAAAECDKDDDVRPKHGIATTASSWRANPLARIKLSGGVILFGIKSGICKSICIRMSCGR